MPPWRPTNSSSIRKTNTLEISQAPIERTLPRLAAIHPRLAEAVVRQAAGFEPASASSHVRTWLEQHRGSFAPVLDGGIEKAEVLDLSISSPLLHGAATENGEKKLTARILSTLENADAEVGVGRFDEVRYFYTSEIFGDSSDVLAPRRVIHLGLDLFASAGRKVAAPLPGRVFAFGRNEGQLDYGPLVILEHDADGVPFGLSTVISASSLWKGSKKVRPLREVRFLQLWETPRSTVVGLPTFIFS